MGWVLAKAKTKKQDDTNGRVKSSCDVHMHPQRANIPLQGLDSDVLTLGTISGPHCKIGALQWYHFTSNGFAWLEKKHSGEADQFTLAS